MKRIISLLLCAVMILGFAPFLERETKAAFAGADKIKIVIDPGHGGSSVGTAAKGIGEKEMTYRLALLLKKELDANGNFTVYITRSGDYDLELYERAQIANNYNADILISLHFDGNPSSSLNGVTCFTSVLDKYAATTLANSISYEVASATGLKNNGTVRRKDNAGYYWNTQKQWDCQDPSLGALSDYYGIPTWCAKFGFPSVIVEHGYFTNSHDVGIIFADGTLEKMAKADAKAIISYYTNHTHVYSSSTVDYASNCVYTGKASEKCTICGHRRNVTGLGENKDNHYWEHLESTPASCGVDGKVVSRCRITQSLADKGWKGTVHTNTQIIPAPTQHTFVITDQREVSHTVDGYKKYSCKTCSYTFKDVYKAEGHSYELTASAEATCTENGYKTYKCPVCTHEYSEIYNALGHILPEGSVKAPTCTEDGITEGKCTRCSAEVKETAPKLGHSFEKSAHKAPTCALEGEEISKCSRCALEEKRILPAAGHTYVEKAVKPTCDSEGEKIFTCSVCNDSYKESIPAPGHKKSTEGKVIKKETLFDEGKLEYKCENGCGKVYTEKIESVFNRNKTEFILIGAGSALFLCALAFVIILIIRKKKRSSEKEEAESPVTVDAVAKEAEPSEEPPSEEGEAVAVVSAEESAEEKE